MAKTIAFKAYDPQRKKQHTIATPPVKITSCRFSAEEWKRSQSAAGSAGKVKKGGKTKRQTKKKRTPRSAADVLRCSSDESHEIECLRCGEVGNDADVNILQSISHIETMY